MAQKLNIKSLAEKYQDFNDPNVKVMISEKEVAVSDEVFLEMVEVTSSVGEEPNMAVLLYQVSCIGATAISTMESHLNVGVKVEVKAGYGEELTRIFLGYLHEIKVTGYKGDTVEYALVCLDVKGLMKKVSSFQISGKKKAQEMLDEILDTSAYKFLIEKKSVDTLPSSFNQDCVIRGETHYDWLCALSKYLNYEFFCSRGELYFQKAMKDTTVILELNRKYGLQEVCSTVSMAGQFGSVQVVGYNRKDEKVSGISQWKTVSGSFTQKLKQSLQGCERVFWDKELETGEQASDRAEAIMKRISGQCSRMRAVNVGIPELCPGVCVEIAKSDEKSDVTSLLGTIYVEETVHLLNRNGYRTIVEGTRTA